MSTEKHFKGEAKIFNETFYVNTETLEGVDKVLKKIDPLLCKMASRTYISGYRFEDIKQELSIMAIKGMRAYDASKNTSLSTFLYRHIDNKLISKLKNANKLSNDADISGSKDDGSKIRKSKEELTFSRCGHRYSNGEQVPFEYSLSESDGFYQSAVRRFDDVDFEISMRQIIKTSDPVTAKILRLICFEDYTLKEAADEVGLSPWAASIRVKNLASRYAVKSILGRVDE